jgi:PII-like signaling protein
VDRFELKETWMKGYQISFITTQGHDHKGKPLGDWLMHVAMEMGFRGATVIGGAEGFGKHRRIHSSHFFELADQPIEVVMAVSEEECARLFERLEKEGVHVFYVKAPVEFGEIGS